MKLTEKQIAALEVKGFRRWTKGSLDRLYINAETLGLELDYYKSGNISGATYRGESISNRRGGEMRAAKTFIDIETGELHATNWTLEQDAQQLYEETLEALEAAETTTENEKEDDTMYSVFTEIELLNTQHIDSLDEAREVAATYKAQGHDYEIRDEETGETVDSYIREDEEETAEQANPYTAMTDAELTDAKNEMTRIIQASTSGYNAHITTETRDNALNALHQIRLAMWSRGRDVPTEDDRDEYEYMLRRWNSKLDRATDVTSRYIALNGVRARQDALAWLDWNN